MKILKNYFGILVLLGLWLLILATNFTPETWLSGWDNLHSEFNFSLNIKRSLFATWQEYQGLGLLGGMGHASDLPRQIFLWFISLILPVHFLRYFFHFLMLLIGPVGVYFLLNKNILRRFAAELKKTASLVGAIFYLFNLATLQAFYVPFEPYSVHFAFLPWLFLVNLNYLEKGDKKSLIFLLLVSLLAIPQGYVATCFLVYFIALTFVLFFYYLYQKQSLKKIVIAYLLLFCVNAFWLLPNVYFAVTSADININSKINQMATETNVLQNKKYGNLANTAILKGFWFGNAEVNNEGKMIYQMGNWVDHLQNRLVLLIGYLLFLLCLGGVGFSIKKRLAPTFFFIPVFIFAFIVLSNNTPVFSSINNLFYKIPLFSQIFRFPFTKFALLVAFCLSIFYALAYLFISLRIKNNLLKHTITLSFCFLPIIFLLPIFKGQLFYYKAKAKIPSEYFQVMEFFRHQDENTRVADFPQHTFWGWTLYRWNYSGSGFLWYGIKQSILDRAFDVWSDKNENYYWEIAYALYSQNQALFEQVLEKYQINWLLVDRNILNPSSPKALYLDELEEMINHSEKFFFKRQFGKIKIYQVRLNAPVDNYIFLAENLPQIGPVYQWNNYDQAFIENGNYFSQAGNNLYYPFRSLFTGRGQDELEFEIEDRGSVFVFKKEIPESLNNYQLMVPEGKNRELVFVDPNDFSRTVYLQPEVNLKNQTIEVVVPKVKGLYSAEINPAEALADKTPENCDQLNRGEVDNEIVESGFLRLTSTDANNCTVSFWLEHLPHQLAYLITVEARYSTGKSLLFWLENLSARKADLETYLPKKTNTFYFLQPPMKPDGLMYSLHFDNISIGRVKSVNDLGKITVNPFPFKFLTEIKLVEKSLAVGYQKLTPPLRALHPNPSFYWVEMSPIDNQILVLSQAYHSGWQAYELKNKTPSLLVPVLGKKIDGHVSVNNWENGWLLDNQDKIAIIFLPQYLEYFGFLLLFLFGCFTLIFLLK